MRAILRGRLALQEDFVKADYSFLGSIVNWPDRAYNLLGITHITAGILVIIISLPAYRLFSPPSIEQIKCVIVNNNDGFSIFYLYSHLIYMPLCSFLLYKIFRKKDIVKVEQIKFVMLIMIIESFIMLAGPFLSKMIIFS